MGEMKEPLLRPLEELFSGPLILVEYFCCF